MILSETENSGSVVTGCPFERGTAPATDAAQIAGRKSFWWRWNTSDRVVGEVNIFRLLDRSQDLRVESVLDRRSAARVNQKTKCQIDPVGSRPSADDRIGRIGLNRQLRRHLLNLGKRDRSGLFDLWLLERDVLQQIASLFPIAFVGHGVDH